MKIESTAFTWADLHGFVDEMREQERLALADRIERDSARLAELAARLDEAASAEGADGDDWSARDVLAHIAVFSKFYGMLTYKVGSGQVGEYDVMGAVRQRDPAAQQLASLSLAQLVQAIQSDHRRTVEYLRSVDAAAMQRRLDVGEGMSVSADDIARLFLCAHLERHLDQLERALVS